MPETRPAFRNPRPPFPAPFRAPVALALAAALAACSGRDNEEYPPMPEPRPSPPPAAVETATFGGGCFWCVEAVYQELDGVISVMPGYAGGTVENPTYEQVCTGETGHAEAIQVRYDPAKVRYEDVLEVFWKTHDPTTLNRQGHDVGTQYRSVIFYHDDKQKAAAERIKKELDASGAWDRPIVTEIAPFTKFYPAEEYHRDYFRRNPEQGYCRAVIAPKMEKFRKAFGAKRKKRP